MGHLYASGRLEQFHLQVLTGAVAGAAEIERGVGGLRARVAEEHVVEVAGRKRRDPARKLEGARMAELEGRREVEGGAIEVVTTRLPALIAAQKGMNEPRYASLPNIMPKGTPTAT